VTLLVASLAGDLDQHAQGYLAGNAISSTRDASREGVPGKAWRFASPGGATRYALLLLQEENQAYGLYSQAEAARFEEHAAVVDEMEASFTLERPPRYPEHRNDKMAFSLRVPASWRSTRAFSGGGTHVLQFTSPALGVERDQTVHASLSLTTEPIAVEAGLEGFYKASRDRLGEPFKLLTHATWKDGYVDLMRSETPMAVSRLKRYYRAQGGRGYTLAFEARDDVFHRVSRWCDMIAGTLRVGPEVSEL